MNDLPSHRPAEVRPALRERIRGAIAPVTETAVPGALIGALYLTTGTHWETLKATLGGWGVPIGATVFAAPAVGIAAVVALRYLWRLVNPPADRNE
jgi:hypothetical protein